MEAEYISPESADFSITLAMTCAGGRCVADFMASAKRHSPQWEADLANEVFRSMSLIQQKELLF